MSLRIYICGISIKNHLNIFIYMQAVCILLWTDCFETSIVVTPTNRFTVVTPNGRISILYLCVVSSFNHLA